MVGPKCIGEWAVPRGGHFLFWHGASKFVEAALAIVTSEVATTKAIEATWRITAMSYLVVL
jgi:hypothetical protein